MRCCEWCEEEAVGRRESQRLSRRREKRETNVVEDSKPDEENTIENEK